MLREAEGGRRMWDTGEPLRAENWSPLPDPVVWSEATARHLIHTAGSQDGGAPS